MNSSDRTSIGGSRLPGEATAPHVESGASSSFRVWTAARCAPHAGIDSGAEPTCQSNQPASDAVDPAHYRVAHFELIEVLREVKGPAAYCRAAAIKYLFRAGNKPGQDAALDLQKALRMVQFALEEVQP